MICNSPLKIHTKITPLGCEKKSIQSPPPPSHPLSKNKSNTPHPPTTPVLNSSLKVGFHTNENPLKNSEKNCMCWSKVNVSKSEKKKPFFFKCH